MPKKLQAASLTDNARTVMAKRYLIKDENGAPTEAPETMLHRVASTVAAVDAEYGASPEEVEELTQEFYNLMAQRLFYPNSPTLMNAGRPLGQLSACFVLPVEDSLATTDRRGIYDTLRNMALIHQSGGGTGFSFSRIRAKGSVVRSTTGVASGPVSFMALYDASTDVVKQGGTRRGANMGILRVDHPDILEFIDCKSDTTKITNFNISVAVTDDFMRAVELGGDYQLTNGEWMDAREVFELLVDHAHATGEPGLFFIDQANRYNPVPHMGDYEATNPCGEQPLLPYDVCNLGSINVGLFVDDYGDIQWNRLREVIHTTVHFLDNIINANEYPLPEVRQLADNIRRVGLGIMGWADLLIRMGVRYGSKQSIVLAQSLSDFLKFESHQASMGIAGSRGAFPEWELSIWGPDATCARDKDGKRIQPMQYMRNCNLTTVAPTGTISIFADCSSGIEPLFAVAFKRFQADEHMVDVNKDFLRELVKEYGPVTAQQICEQAAELGHIPESVHPRIWEVFVTAHEVTPEEHVAMQAAFQENIDSAISKTINFGNKATREDVRSAYFQAWKSGCKGITVYRDGCRDFQPLSTGATGKKEPVIVTEVAVNLGDSPVVGDLLPQCPECGSGLVFESGCEKCAAGCGYSACVIS